MSCLSRLAPEAAAAAPALAAALRRYDDVEANSDAERLAGRRLTKDGVIVITAARFRSQDQNRDDALARLVDLLQKAAERPIPRRPTRPSLAAKRRRLNNKAQRGALKKLRSRKPEDD